MPISLYAKMLPSDYELSGPKIWPSIIAEEAWDRYIFRRPELGYLKAKREIDKDRRQSRREPAEYVQIRILRSYHDGNSRGPRRRQLHKWNRLINRDDTVADVRDFLEQLRHLLSRCMPDRPLPDCQVWLQFTDPAGSPARVVGSWQETWI